MDAVEPEQDLLKLDLQICFALYAASRAMTNAYRPLLSGLDLTYPQYLVMLVLWERQDLTVGELGSRLYLDSGTLTPLLKRLETRGLLSRRRDAQDERQVRITLTEAGELLKQEAVSVPTGIKCRLQLPEQTVDLLRRELGVLLESLQSLAEVE